MRMDGGADLPFQRKAATSQQCFPSFWIESPVRFSFETFFFLIEAVCGPVTIRFRWKVGDGGEGSQPLPPLA